VSESLKPLLELQEVDSTRDRLHERKERLPEKAELADLEQRMAEVRAEIERVDADTDAVMKEVNRLEGEIRTVDEKIVREEKRLYGGEVVNPKELSALQDEISMLKRQKAPKEEDELARLMRRDELGEEKARLQAELADLGREADMIRARIQAATADIDADLDKEEAKRQALLPVIPADVGETYESLREQKRGVGVGALQNGICSACREALSAVEVDRIKRKQKEGELLFRCEHCRRLLVVG
jgi:predicted  nucleic acid-binding Zn-ribbon protein